MEMIRKKKDMSEFDNHVLACLDLELILTQKCNLSCAHCMRGDCSNKQITADVLDSVFSKFFYIDNLSLGGGEITLIPETINLVTEKLKEHKVTVHHCNFTSNGTIVNDEVLNALKNLQDYIVSCDELPSLFRSSKKQKQVPMFVCFSFDEYHLLELEKRGITAEQLFENISKYQKVFGLEAIECRLACDMDVYDTGRATNLPSSANKVSLHKVMSEPYPFINLDNEALLIGNIIVVSCDGEIVPANISFKDEKALSFGNFKTHSVGQILSNMNAIETDANGYNKARAKLFNSMTAPKKYQKAYKKMGTKKLHYFYYMLEQASQKQQ